MTKQKILKVATQEFSIYGYDGLSMNKLASKLEVNKATIYYHFKDKKSLYQEVIKSLVNMRQDEIKTLIESDRDPKEKFRQYIELFSKKILDNPQIVPLALREMANLGVNVEGSIEDDFDQEIESLIKIVGQLNLKERYKDLDPYLIKSILFGTFNSYYSMQMSNVKLTKIKNFDKNNSLVLEYTSQNIATILLDALCKD